MRRIRAGRGAAAGPVRTPGPLPDPQLCRRSLRSAPPRAAGRSKRGQQPGAGAAAVPGVMERGHRREPVSDRVHPAGGAGSDRAETPGPQLRGGPVGAGCRGCQCHRRGCRKSEGVATPGALAGAATLPFDARAALRLRECPTEGAPAAGLRGPFGERRAGFGGGRTCQRPTRLPVGGAAAARPEGPVPHERQAWPASAAMVTRGFR